MSGPPPQIDCMLALEPNPKGLPPNFVNPENMFRIHISATLPVAILMFLFIAIRIYDSLKRHHKLWLDDWFALAAVAFFIADWGINLTTSKYTRHAWDTSLCFTYPGKRQLFAINTLIYNFLIFLSKATLSFLYLRIFGSVQWMRYVILISISLYGLICLAAIPVFIYYLFPSSKGEKWDSHMDTKWRPMSPFGVLATCATLMIDIVLASLSIYLVLQLKKLSLRRKVGLAIALAAGFFATIATAINFYYRIMWQFHPRGVQDSTWLSGMTFILCDLETSITIIVSCIPAIASAWRSALVRFIPFSFQSKESGGNQELDLKSVPYTSKLNCSYQEMA